MKGISDYFVSRNNSYEVATLRCGNPACPKPDALDTALSKERNDGVVFFKRMLVVLGAITVISAIIPNTPEKSDTVTIASCQEATVELEKILNARDAISVDEAMTPDGRKKWEELRDRGIKAASIKDELCY